MALNESIKAAYVYVPIKSRDPDFAGGVPSS